MFSSTVLKRVHVIISDGDSREYNQIDNAIETYLPGLIRIRCGWHIVDIGWNINMSSKREFGEHAHDF